MLLAYMSPIMCVDPQKCLKTLRDALTDITVVMGIPQWVVPVPTDSTAFDATEYTKLWDIDDHHIGYVRLSWAVRFGCCKLSVSWSDAG